jgi:hypothetical protein
MLSSPAPPVARKLCMALSQCSNPADVCTTEQAVHLSPVFPEVDGVAVRPTKDAVKASIAEFTESLAPKIHAFLTTPHFSPWFPPAADKKTQEFYKNLNIPLVNGEPCLLLHDLGRSNAGNLFEGPKHK